MHGSQRSAEPRLSDRGSGSSDSVQSATVSFVLGTRILKTQRETKPICVSNWSYDWMSTVTEYAFHRRHPRGRDLSRRAFVEPTVVLSSLFVQSRVGIKWELLLDFLEYVNWYVETGTFVLKLHLTITLESPALERGGLVIYKIITLIVMRATHFL